MKPKNNRRILWGVVLASVCAGALACGCAAQTEDEGTLMETYEPKLVIREDGVEIQRTPSENLSASEEGDGVYHKPVRNVPKNTFYLKADDRGCNACHEDLLDTVSTTEYNHPKLTNDIGTETTVQQCITCHTEGQVTIANSFGGIVHGIHSEVEDADCWSCHYASEDGNDMQLWDNVKHQVMHGIHTSDTVEGTFNFNQDRIVSQDQLPNINWQGYENDYLRNEKTESGAPLDQDMLDNWTITVTGMVDNEMTFSLKDLIENAESVTTTMVEACVEIGDGNNLIGQAEVTGIPLSALLEKAGVQPEGGTVMVNSSDGFNGAFDINLMKTHEPLLVYQINGEPIQWQHGYPVQLWLPGGNATTFVKQVSNIEIAPAEVLESYPPFYLIDFCKPVVGFTNLDEGQVLKKGEPFTVEGYAYAFSQPVKAMEFSLDGGETWTRCDTPDTVTDKWVNWALTITPQEEHAYVLRVRCVAANDMVNEDVVEKMFNVKAK
ncbi:molybdopterin-dependent oxidoreductase [Adlercreutzia sp. R25]|uniref:molybdopterin-dependent oxidoreductase n=1 Tax=Adlercreutzia shanghongiae TaxID=3111773 RepID=UPI002DBDC04C|nr:molybdopterin-dependent oxidoreductase [Adlercreutzia sp. R25]MEC4271877.1 molybdopterin-dependent oxidoreductase [Adlercreutzia sp. R25]